MYADYKRKKQLLKAAGARLSRPKMVAAFSHWQHDWEAEKDKAASMSHAQQLSAESSARVAAEQELATVRKELNDARKAMAEGRGQETEMQRRHEEQLEQERQARV